LVSIETELLLKHKNKRFVYCTIILFNLEAQMAYYQDFMKIQSPQLFVIKFLPQGAQGKGSRFDLQKDVYTSI
jgi:hypothetical protein